jgi:hypothetical protein
MIGADVLEKLKGFELSKRDIALLYTALKICTLAAAAVIGLIVWLLLVGKDVAALKDIAANLIWADLGLVIVFVAGNVAQRRAAAKIIAPAPEAKP